MVNPWRQERGWRRENHLPSLQVDGVGTCCSQETKSGGLDPYYLPKWAGTQSLTKTPILPMCLAVWDLWFSRYLELVAPGKCCLYWQKNFPLIPYC